jgi:putative ABC transport system permease protein
MIAERLYRALLRFAPADLRERHSDEMIHLLRGEVLAARQRGRLAAIRAAFDGLADLAARLVYEHWRRIGRPRIHDTNRSSIMNRIGEAVSLDVRFALRSLRRRPVFAVVAVGTIALSIGAATAMYSVVDGVLFRSLPYRDADRIVQVWQTDEVSRRQSVIASNWDRTPLDYTDFLVWRERQRSFAGVAVWSGALAFMAGPNGPEQVSATRVSPGLFELFGVVPALGRTFARGEDVIGGPRLAIISHERWRSHHGARPDIIGTRLLFGDDPYQVIGVLPPGFTLERGKPGAAYWIPAGQEPGDIGRRNRSFLAIARLRADVSIEQAMTEARVLLSTQNAPGTPSMGVRVVDFVREETRDVRRPMLLLLGAVGVLLLISCVNIAILLLGEASTRETEMSARVAIGATRARIIGQLLTESVLLSFIGSALGIGVAWWATRGIVALAPAGLPGILGVHLDGRVLGAAVFVTIATGIIFGLAPAITLSQARPARLLRSGSATRGGGALQRSLVATELALCVVLLVGAGLLTRSLRQLSTVDPGFRSDRLLTVQLSRARYWEDSAGVTAFYRDVIPRIATIPGVGGVTAASEVPFTGRSSSSPYILVGEGEAELRSRKHQVQQRIVLDNYFAVMGIPMAEGRGFGPGDRATTERVAILSEAAARRDFPGRSPIGERVRYQGEWRRIVGVARDTKVGKLSTDAQPSIYTPASQRFGLLDIIVRTSGDPAALAPSIRQVTRQAGPRFAITNIRTMDDLIRSSFAEERFRTALVALFASIAALLVSIGMFGVTARAVARRTREVGIRVALGSTTTSVVGLIVRQTMGHVTIGIAIGLGAALVASRLLTPYLFGVSSTDPVTYGTIFVLLAAVALLASWLPARRAGRVQPATVLRSE